MLFAIFTYGQTTITGTVVDENGNPVPNANVVPEEDIDAALALPGVQPVPLRPTEEAKQVREQYCAYLNTTEAVEWQRRMVGL